MGNQKQIVAALLTAFAGIASAYSQHSFNIHFGPSFPVGFSCESFIALNIYYDSVSDLNNDNPVLVIPAPKYGFSTGFRYLYQLPGRNIGFFLGTDFFYNKPDNEFRDSTDYLVYYRNEPMTKTPSYYSIPVTLGFDFQFPAASLLKVDLNIALTRNFLKISDYVVAGDIQNTDWANSLGIKAGAGAIFRNRISIELNYLALGTHDIDGRFIYLDKTYRKDRYYLHFKLQYITVSGCLWF